MKKHSFAVRARFVTVMALVALGVCLCIPAAMSQDDMKEIKAPAFAEHTRAPAVFLHDNHNEKAGIEECETCHHGGDKETGIQDKTDNTAGSATCADCHSVDAKKGTPLMRAYHQQCITCHQQKNSGPTYCGGCHVDRS